jgi:hypothetical protein
LARLSPPHREAGGWDAEEEDEEELELLLLMSLAEEVTPRLRVEVITITRLRQSRKREKSLWTLAALVARLAGNSIWWALILPHASNISDS